MDTRRAAPLLPIPGLEEVWAQTHGDSRICIALLDGPINLSHPTISAANLTQITSSSLYPTSEGLALEHGTHIASILFGQHESLVRGLAPKCRGLVLPIFGDQADGSLVPCSQLDLARAMTQAAEQGAHIINISGGEFSSTGKASPILADTVKACAQQGILIIAAAGNQGCDCLNVPGALPSVLAVGAMDTQGHPLLLSNWGEIYETQGILALGQDIPGASLEGGVVTHTGTSYATAIVSGIAALMLSLQLLYGQTPDPLAVRSALLRSAITCDDESATDCRRLLAGRLNVRGAVALLLKGEIPKMSEYHQSSENAVTPVIPADSGPPMEFVQAHQTSADAQIIPADCGCGCGGKGGENCSCGKSSQVNQIQQVYALGKLGYDFGSVAQRDSLQQDVGAGVNLDDHAQFLDYLDANPWVAGNVTWILNLEATPIYAIAPQGAFARETYERLRQFLKEQLTEGVERISLPGLIVGQTRLISGQTVPLVVPELRGMYSWTTRALVELVTGAALAANAKEEKKSEYHAKVEGVTNFLNRIYYEFRNLGLTSAQRALNYAGVNIARTTEIFSSTATANMELDSIEVEPSPIGPPGSDCWDVRLTFFNVNNERASRRAYQITVNVAAVCPTIVAQTRSWHVR